MPELIPSKVIMRKINIDTRAFALPIPRTGSIETHSGYGSAPMNGQDIHLMIQKRRLKEFADYQTEKKISMSLKKDKYVFIISGRVDGLIPGENPCIEEIKSAFEITALEKKLLEQPDHPYILQLKSYGYMYYLEHKIVPTLNLLLVSSRNFKTKTMTFNLDIESYENWMDSRLEEMVLETKRREKIFAKRIQSGTNLAFPFPRPRDGQMELISTIDDHFDQCTPLLVQAPTGLGKTAGVLYPALKEALVRGQKVVYVTPKNSQHQVAQEAVSLMQNSGAKIKALTLTAKSKMCLKEEPICNPAYCEYAKDHYAKVADNDLVNIVNKKKNLTNKTFIKLGKEHLVCPFELSLEAVESADVVIADYNYVFSPRSLIGRLSEPLLEQKEKANLIIDEAHNLHARAQDYFSATLTSSQLELFVKAGIPNAKEALALIALYRGSPRKINIEIKPFHELEQKIRDFTMDYLDSDEELQPQDPVLKFSNLFSDFVSALDSSGEAFFQTYQTYYGGELLKVTCCDAAYQLQLAYKEFKNTVGFSATLKPFSYYQTLMGFKENSSAVEFASPFLKTNRKLVFIPQISTKFKDRRESTMKICEVIDRITRLKSGNYIALFPSFDFMNMVAREMKSEHFEILIQPREMKNKETKMFLGSLQEKNRPKLVFAVQGGVLAEGVDYPGEMLIGAFVVGPALPNFDFEREQIKTYYDQRFGVDKGFDYAYVYPAMAKAIQSAGRVIRTETDRGLIVLIDPRFLERSYSQTMPKEWFNESPHELVSKQILQDVRDFWESSE